MKSKNEFHLGNFHCCAWARTASDLLADVLSQAKKHEDEEGRTIRELEDVLRSQELPMETL